MALGGTYNTGTVTVSPPKSATATISIASPAVVGLTAHGFGAGQPFKFSTTGAVPTGAAVGTTYYVIAAGLTANAFEFSATIGGAAINTSGSQSGVHTVAVDGLNVAGNGVLWTDVVEGDWVAIGTAVAVVDSVNGTFNAITLKDPWAGSAQVAANYRILKMSWLRYDPSLTQERLRTFIVDIEAAGLFLFVSGSAPDPSLGEDGQYALKTNDPSSPWQLWLKTDGTWVLQPNPAGGRYDIAVWTNHTLSVSEIMINFVVPSAVTFRAGLTDSQAKAIVAATGSTVLSLQKNGTPFGTVTFSASGTVGAFAAATDTAFAAGDVLAIIGPASPDATLSEIALTLTGYR